MIREANMVNPPDPRLANAMRATARKMKKEQVQIAQWMRAAKHAYPDIVEGMMVSLTTNGQEIIVPYTDAEQVDAIGDFIVEVSEKVAEPLASAVTLEGQCDMLLGAMRDMLICGTLDEVYPKQASCMVTAIEELFDQFSIENEPRSRALLDTQHAVHYYARIVFDSIDGVNGLVRAMQQEAGVPTSHMVPTPFALAWKRRLQASPVRSDHASFYEREGLTQEASAVLCEALTSYQEVLPTPMGVDTVGLILRCAEEVSELAVPARHKTLIASNDNAPDDSGALLNHPLVRRRMLPILGELFRKHPDIAQSPMQTIEACWTLEELLAREKARQNAQGRS